MGKAVGQDAAGRAEQVAIGVGDEARNRSGAVGAAQVDQCGGRARVTRASLFNLKHSAEKEGAAEFCHAEQVAVGIGDQAGHRFYAVGAVEADQRGRRAGVTGRSLGDLEHRADADRPALICRPEQVAIGVGDQAGQWTGAVGAVEADQRGGGPRITTSSLGDFEHRAVAVRAAEFGCAEQVAAGVGEQAERGNAPSVPLKLTTVVGVLA